MAIVFFLKNTINPELGVEMSQKIGFISILDEESIG